jgi:hypothetical protein
MTLQKIMSSPKHAISPVQRKEKIEKSPVRLALIELADYHIVESLMRHESTRLDTVLL